MIKFKNTSLEGFLIIESNYYKDDHKELENKIVVITGRFGYIGSALIEKLVYL